jgi:Sec7-like guanine-nucleotide exchange factor
MTAESFFRNNRGIAGRKGGDLPDEVLTGIFNRIKGASVQPERCCPEKDGGTETDV